MLLSNNLNILNQQQQQHQQQLLPSWNYDNFGDYQPNTCTSTKKQQQKKVNIVSLNIQHPGNQLPQLQTNQTKPNWLQEQLQSLIPLQQRRKSEAQPPLWSQQQRVKTQNQNDKENFQLFLQEQIPRSKTPYNGRETNIKEYEREVCSSMSKTREQGTAKINEVNIFQQNALNLEGKNRSYRRQSLDQHYLNSKNNLHESKKERNQYNNYLGQLQVSSSSTTAAAATQQQNKQIQKFSNQQSDEYLQKSTCNRTVAQQIELEQASVQNSFLNVKQILKNQSTQYLSQETHQSDETKSYQQQQNAQNQSSSQNINSLQSLMESVPLNSIVKGQVSSLNSKNENIKSTSTNKGDNQINDESDQQRKKNNQTKKQKINTTYITSLVSPISDDSSLRNTGHQIVSSSCDMQSYNISMNKQKVLLSSNDLDSTNNQENFEVTLLSTKTVVKKSINSYSSSCEQPPQRINDVNKPIKFQEPNKLVQIDINVNESSNSSQSQTSKAIKSDKDKSQANQKKTEENLVSANGITANNDKQKQQEENEMRLLSENERMAKVFNNFEIQQRIKRIRSKKISNTNGLESDQSKELQSAYYNINTSAEEYVNTKEDEDIIFQNLSLYENQVLNNDKIEINLDGISKGQSTIEQQLNPTSVTGAGPILNNSNILQMIDTFRRDKLQTARSGNSNILNVNLIPNPSYSSTNKEKSKSIQPNVLKGKKLTLKQILEKNQKLKKQMPFHLLRNEAVSTNQTVSTMNSQTMLQFFPKNGFLQSDPNYTLKSEIGNNISNNQDILQVQRIDLHSADSSCQPSQRCYGNNTGSGGTNLIRAKLTAGSVYTKTTIDDDNSNYARNAYNNHTNEMIKTNASIYMSQLMSKTKEDDNVEGKPIILIQEDSMLYQQNHQQQQQGQSGQSQNEYTKQLSCERFQSTIQSLENKLNNQAQRRRRKSAITTFSSKMDTSSISNNNCANDDCVTKISDMPTRKASLNTSSFKLANLNQNYQQQQQQLLQKQISNHHIEVQTPINKKSGRKTIISTLNYKELKQNDNSYILEQDQKEEQCSPEKSLDVAYMNQILHSKKTASKYKQEPPQTNKYKQTQNAQTNQINNKKAVSLSLYHIAGNTPSENTMINYPQQQQQHQQQLNMHIHHYNPNKQPLAEKKFQPISLYQQAQQSFNHYQKQQQSLQKKHLQQQQQQSITCTSNFYSASTEMKLIQLNSISNQ